MNSYTTVLVVVHLYCIVPGGIIVFAVFAALRRRSKIGSSSLVAAMAVAATRLMSCLARNCRCLASMLVRKNASTSASRTSKFFGANEDDAEAEEEENAELID